MAHHDEDDSYHPTDAVAAAVKAAYTTGIVGIAAAAAQVTVHKENMRPSAVVTRFGSTTTIMSTTYSEPEF